MLPTDDATATCFWTRLPLRMFKNQSSSPIAVLFRTTHTRTNSNTDSNLSTHFILPLFRFISSPRAAPANAASPLTSPRAQSPMSPWTQAGCNWELPNKKVKLKLHVLLMNALHCGKEYLLIKLWVTDTSTRSSYKMLSTALMQWIKPNSNVSWRRNVQPHFWTMWKMLSYL